MYGQSFRLGRSGGGFSEMVCDLCNYFSVSQQLFRVVVDNLDIPLEEGISGKYVAWFERFQSADVDDSSPTHI